METIIKDMVDRFLQENPTLCVTKATALAIIRPHIEAKLNRCIESVYDELTQEEDDCDDWDYDDDGENE
jgi:hypothetical protein